MTDAFLKMALADSCDPEMRKQEEDACNANPMYMRPGRSSGASRSECYWQFLAENIEMLNHAAPLKPMPVKSCPAQV